jgi:hypothetical protein
VNVAYQPRPASPSSPRYLCALRVGVYPDPVGALSFSFPPHLLALSTLFPNSHRITSFAHPRLLTPIESYSCKKQGGGVPLTSNRGRQAFCLCATHRNSRNSIPFMRLLHNSRTSPGGQSILSAHPGMRRPISASSIGICSSGKHSRKPFRMRSFKTLHLKSFGMCSYKKTGGGEPIGGVSQLEARERRKSRSREFWVNEAAR